MKSPDKIYVCIPQRLNASTFKEDSKYVGIAYMDRGNLTSPQIEEYIHKDALLKKLEKVANSYKKRSDEGELVWQNMCGIKEAIEILNSM